MNAGAAAPIKGAPVARTIKAAVARIVAEREGTPCLVNVVVGDDGASESYLAALEKLAAKLGIDARRIALPADCDEGAVCAAVEDAGSDPGVHGVMIQFPLPEGLDRERVASFLPAHKDVDGITAASLGACLAGTRRHTAPATAAAVVELLAADPETRVAGKHVVVLGRSLVVGRPLAAMLARPGDGGNATVTLCHSRTADVAGHCRRADVLVVAVGKQHLVTPDWVAPGAVVVDVGTHPVEGPDGWTLAGDVHPDVGAVAGRLTPVPGGVGPVTNAVLMRHVAAACHPDAFPPAW